MEEPSKAPSSESSEPKRSPWADIARYSQLAFALPAGTVVGWLMGAALDHWLGTTWINRVGLALGIAAGFLELIRGALRLKDQG